MRMVTIGLVFTLSLSACDTGQFTQTKNTTEFVVSMTNRPHPIIAGQPTKIFLTLRKERSGVTGCRARLAVSPTHAEAADDPQWRDVIEEGKAGIYTIKSNFFPAEGDWRIDLLINCTGIDRKVDFVVTAEATP